MDDHNQNAEGEFGHVDKVASLLGRLHIFHHCLGFVGFFVWLPEGGVSSLGVICIVIVVFHGFTEGRLSPMQKIVDNYRAPLSCAALFFRRRYLTRGRLHNGRYDAGVMTTG